MSSLKTMREWAEEYLTHRRALGFELRVEGRQLLQFAAYADALGQTRPLTVELALRWARLPEKATPLYWARRLEVVRLFARYMSQFEPSTEVPGPKLLGSAHHRNPPHIYSDGEIRALLHAAAHLSPANGLRPRTYTVLFGLLACTGLRVGEALKLDQPDVDLDGGTLTVRLSKFRKSRLVPLHPSAIEVLRRYVQCRDRYYPVPHSPAFLIGEAGNRLAYSTVRHAFNQLRSQLRWSPDVSGRLPHIHDLRHTFACRRLLTWCEARIDVHHAMTALSTYLGHAKASDTYWYLTATPELLAVCGEQFEEFTRLHNEQIKRRTSHDQTD